MDAGMIDADACIDDEGERHERKHDARERERLGTRGEERNHQRRHAEIIGVALLQAERARRVAETLENMRKQDGRERDRKPDGADQHELAGKRVG